MEIRVRWLQKTLQVVSWRHRPTSTFVYNIPSHNTYNQAQGNGANRLGRHRFSVAKYTVFRSFVFIAKLLCDLTIVNSGFLTSEALSIIRSHIPIISAEISKAIKRMRYNLCTTKYYDRCNCKSAKAAQSRA
jgi:hypothetical protein